MEKVESGVPGRARNGIEGPRFHFSPPSLLYLHIDCIDVFLQHIGGKAPAELFLGRRLPIRLDRLKPDPRNKMEIEVWKQKVYHDANVRACSFRQGDEVWVKNECKTGWHPGVVERRTGKLSYEFLVSGKIRRKHADQICSRSGATDDKPTPTVENQQQEVEVQEASTASRATAKRTRFKTTTRGGDSVTEGKNSMRRGCQLIQWKPHPTQLRMVRSLNPHQTSQSSRNQCYEDQTDLASHPLTMDLTNNFNEENPQILIECLFICLKKEVNEEQL
ncbi:hypothetical protein J437_LFUL014394 [Ladona fulva]|uniref:Uncharacterized protein n=1 Tax=Ladona fulva TaxID=123851 RepID=A0A8K0KL79_LADFU|nr:hypothetical protein J437_LFUL014394 [Ladona fulva]